jgi:hypothetical protein
MQPFLQVAKRLAWIAMSAVLGGIAAFISTVLIADWASGGPACEPDEAAGCGAAVVLGAIVVSGLIGIPGGAIGANALVRYLSASGQGAL